MTHSKASHTAGFRNAETDQLREDHHSEENTKGISNHIKAAEHFALASKFHYEAARYHEEGNHEKANQSALLAIGHCAIANDYQTEDARHHTMES